MKRSRISARFLWIAGTRMCEEVSPASWMMSSARSVSWAVIPSPLEVLVEPGLVGGYGLDLDHLPRVVVLRYLRDYPVRLCGVARPVDVTAGPLHRLFEL